MVGVASGSLQAGYGQPTGRLTARVIWPGLKIGGHLAPFHTHHMNRVNSCRALSYVKQHHKHYRHYYYHYEYLTMNQKFPTVTVRKYLVWCASRDEDRVANTLQYCETANTVLIPQPLSQCLIEVPRLVVDGIVVRLNRFADLVSNLCVFEFRTLTLKISPLCTTNTTTTTSTSTTSSVFVCYCCCCL